MFIVVDSGRNICDMFIIYAALIYFIWRLLIDVI